MKKAWINIACSMVLGVISFAVVCPADTTTWDGSTDTDWFNDDNWDNGHPLAGDTVVIGAGADVLLTNATELIDSLTMDGGTLTFSNWYACVIASNVVLNGGTVTLPGAFTELQMSNRVWIVCSNDFAIGAAATIDVDAKGFAKEQGPGYGIQYAGGGYGGRGGAQSGGGPGGAPYGSTNAPLAPGSGGGTHAAATGGGAVRIHAEGTATIHGAITADGGQPQHYGGGGSGGAVYITCDTFGGSTTGLISVAGGDCCPWSGPLRLGSGGGGGRIAVDYNSVAATHGVRFRASKGVGNFDLWVKNWYAFPLAGHMGTLWLPDMALLSETLQDELFANVALHIEGVTSWSPDTLTVSNCWVTFGHEGFVLTVTNDLRIDNGDLGLHGTLITQNGDLILTNGASLHMYANPTNSPSPDYGARVSIGGDVSIADSSWIYPIAQEVNGATVLLEMNNLTIAAGGGINADGRGYGREEGPGGGPPGRGGAGYGGRGGYYGGSPGSSPYGTTNSVTAPGSGGGSTLQGGYGGGSVRIDATGAVTIDGTVSANGLRTLSSGGSGASGGGIDIQCTTFDGAASGLLQAEGGGGVEWGAGGPWYGGGGGGGRIAVWQGFTPAIRSSMINGQPAPANVMVTNIPFDTYAGTVSVTNGYGWGCESVALDDESLPGTVAFLLVLPPNGTMILLY